MAIIDMYADFLGGRSQYDADNIRDLKHQVSERLNRNDINWDVYDILVNDNHVGFEHSYQDGDVIKVISPAIKAQAVESPQLSTMVGLLEQLVQGQQVPLAQTGTFPSLVVKRPFIKPEIKQPSFAALKQEMQYVGTYACGRCGGNIIVGKETCTYCGSRLNWSTVS